METNFYLIIGARKARYSYDGSKYEIGELQVRKNKPKTASNEIAIKVCLDIPDAVFERPQLEASITVADDQISAPIISADVADNIGKVLSEEIGIDVTVKPVEPDNDRS